MKLKPALALTSIATAIALVSTPAYPISGAGEIAIPIMIGAGAIFGGGVLLEGVFPRVHMGTFSLGDGNTLNFGPGLAGTVVAIVLLDRETGAASFAEINEARAAAFAVPATERAQFLADVAQYNSQLDEVNAVASEVTAAIAAARSQAPQMTPQDLARVAEGAWLQAGASLQTGTKATIARIAAL